MGLSNIKAAELTCDMELILGIFVEMLMQTLIKYFDSEFMRVGGFSTSISKMVC